MIVLVDHNEKVANELASRGIEVGQLLTPLTRRRRWSDVWAVDNGAFAKFDGPGFLRLLDRNKDAKATCRFVAVPDVVGSARRTLEVWKVWAQQLTGWPKALVLQDGIEDLDIPWHSLQAVFIGGTTAFKNSQESMACAKAAKVLGKYVHVGRVNTPERFDRWEKEVQADSCDGTGLSRYSWMRNRLAEGLPLLDAPTPASSAD